jgi:hypothetical protein
MAKGPAARLNLPEKRGRRNPLFLLRISKGGLAPLIRREASERVEAVEAVVSPSPADMIPV